MAEHVKLNPEDIVRSDVALRGVNKESLEYQQLADSIAQVGVLKPIIVNRSKNSDTGETQFVLVDGLQRLSAALDVGLEEIDCMVHEASAMDTMSMQVITNLHTIKTRPAAFGKQIKRMLTEDPRLTKADIAAKLSVTTQWIDQRLDLTTLPDHVQGLVDSGEVNLTNALALTKLARVAPDELDTFVERAKTQETSEFVPAIDARRKEIQDSLKTGKAPKEEEFTPTAYLRKKTEVDHEHKTHEARKAYLEKNPNATAKDAFDFAIAWVLHQDPESIEEQQQKWEARKAEQEEKKQKRKQEREAKKAEAETVEA